MTARAKTAAERQRRWRENRKRKGYQQHIIWLDPDVSRALDAAIIGSKTKQPARQRLINDCLRRWLVSDSGQE